MGRAWLKCRQVASGFRPVEDLYAPRTRHESARCQSQVEAPADRICRSNSVSSVDWKSSQFALPDSGSFM